MIPIMYEDKDIIVVRKPVNMPVVRDFSRSPDMQSTVQAYLGMKPHVIHRLDRHVAGPVVLAKSREMAAGLNRQLRGPGFGKRYLAVIKWNNGALEGRLTHFLRKNRTVAQIVDPEVYDEMSADLQKDYKKARLNFKVIKTESYDTMDIALLEIELITGRFHQIRAQLSHMGMPIIGDPKYGIDVIGSTKFTSIGLQCCCLVLEHPRSGKRMEFESRHATGPFRFF